MLFVWPKVTIKAAIRWASNEAVAHPQTHHFGSTSRFTRRARVENSLRKTSIVQYTSCIVKVVWLPGPVGCVV